jgi:hypothetical protein
MEYASECYCDNQLAASSAVGATNCNMACSGDNMQICGGPGALTLFSNTASTSSVTSTPTSSASVPASSSTGLAAPVANVSTAGPFTYVGCANENNANPGRALPGASYSNATVTNEQCTSFCASQNFKYAGTEYGQECYCGNNLELGSVLTQTGCTFACAGTLAAGSTFAKYSSLCGGSSVLSVWRNENYKPVLVVPSAPGSNGQNYVSQGCYTELSSGRALSGGSTTSASMTVESCVTYCSGKGFSFAGVEYAGECYCANSLSSASVLASDPTTCNMLCKGNALEYCGGPSRLNLYKSTTASRIKRAIPAVMAS